ncbi:MAG: hypothetical protein AAF639_18330 [Chloroflexota bacterium]
MILSGCTRARTETVSLTLDFTEILPSDWTPTQDWQPFSIDGDVATEYLVLYTYNQGNLGVHPVGAAIYDSQQDSKMVMGETVRMPNQPSGLMISYRILPSYWQGTGHGFIAQSNESTTSYYVTRTDANELGLARAEREKEPTPEPTPDEEGNVPIFIDQYDELIILGGNTRMTVIWWKNAKDGYGVTQVYAPGGLRNLDWSGGEVGQYPIKSLQGFYPRHDRSMLCEQVSYERTTDTIDDRSQGGEAAWQQSITYQSISRGLTFCHGIPEHPFYPEGVVLAYLNTPQQHGHLLDDDLPATQKKRIESVIGFDSLIRVHDIRAYATVPVSAVEQMDSEAPLDTSVCVELIVKPDAQTQAQSDSRAGSQSDLQTRATEVRRYLNFSVRHRPPDFDNRLTDRLTIVDVNTVAYAPELPTMRCDEVIE